MVPLNSSVVSVDHHRARDRARHARLFNGVVNFSVYGSADSFYYGIYFTKVKLGTPPKEFNLQIDTGSELTWVSSKSCPSCPRSSRFGIELSHYDVAASSTSKVIPCSDKSCTAITLGDATRCSIDGQYCGYVMKYMDESTTSGFYVADTFHFESVSSSSNTLNASAGILFGIYFTKVKLGTPPKEFNLQIDTGSELTWVSSKSCPSCPRSSRFGIELSHYDVAASSTSKVIPCSDKSCTAITLGDATRCSIDGQYCGYVMKYMDESTTSGFYVADTFHFESVSSSSNTLNASAGILFGDSTYRSGMLAETETAVDGIFGFGKQKLSVLSQLYYKGITPRVFSHCLKGGGTGGGVFVLGEVSAPGMVYTPLVPWQPHYSVHLESIAVNGRPLPVDPQTFIPSTDYATVLDTRTTFSYFVPEAYNLFISAVNNAVSKFGTPRIYYGFQCYAISSRLFPPVSLNFAGGVSLGLKPEEYLFLSNDGSMWCVGFQKVPGQTILGDLVLKDKIFVYDLVQQRIGWVKYDCSSSVNISVPSDDFFYQKQSSSGSSSRGLLVHLLPVAIVTVFFSV
ncbi:unnamed protein product [Linum trigynum]